MSKNFKWKEYLYSSLFSELIILFFVKYYNNIKKILINIKSELIQKMLNSFIKFFIYYLNLELVYYILI